MKLKNIYIYIYQKDVDRESIILLLYSIVTKKIQYEQSGGTIELQKPWDTLALKHLLKVLYVNPFLFFFYF